MAPKLASNEVITKTYIKYPITIYNAPQKEFAPEL